MPSLIRLTLAESPLAAVLTRLTRGITFDQRTLSMRFPVLGRQRDHDCDFRYDHHAILPFIIIQCWLALSHSLSKLALGDRSSGSTGTSVSRTRIVLHLAQ